MTTSSCIEEVSDSIRMVVYDQLYDLINLREDPTESHPTLYQAINLRGDPTESHPTLYQAINLR